MAIATAVVHRRRTIGIAVVLALLVAATPALSEDLVLRQRSTRGDVGEAPHEETVYITERKFVTDGPTLRMIVDLDTGTFTTADKTKQTYTTMAPDRIAALVERARTELAKLPPEQRGAANVLFEDQAPIAVAATGRTEAVAGYEAAEYTLKGGSYEGVLWTTTAVALPAGFERWKTLDGGTGDAQAYGNPLGAAMQKVKGLPLRTRVQVTSGGQTIVMLTEVLKVEHARAPSSVLHVPPGFTREAAPGLQ